MNIDERTKVTCSVRFETKIIRTMQLDDVEFYLSPEDDEENTPMSKEIIRCYVLNLLKDNKIDPNDGVICGEEEDSFMLDNIDEIVSFEVHKPPPPFVDPNQIGLLL